MIEVTGNLWSFPANVRVITANGSVKKNGECVMGRGCALEASQKHPYIPLILGSLIIQHGNHVHWLYGTDKSEIIFSFPVKHKWNEKADPTLIERSAKELKSMMGSDLSVVLPRPGCGNGGLKWEHVKPILTPILDDRFHVITFPPNDDGGTYYDQHVDGKGY